MSSPDQKSSWKVWRFDQIAVNVNDRVKPGDVDVDYYVGLEHLNPDSLKIRRWGSPDDVEATKLLFNKGDIIFGRRRVYQRKLAVADFDGICSAHAMVLRPKTDVVLPEFLPFFMQSDLFMNRALEISVGSLSPTINWKTLAKQEFALPPLEEQRRIAELLERTEDTLRAYQEAHATCKTLLAASLEDLLSPETQGWSTAKIGELFHVVSGGTPRRNRPELWGGGIPWVKTGEVNYSLITSTEEDITEQGLKNSSAKLVPPNSVVMALFGQGPTLGRVGILGIAATTNQACAVILPTDGKNMNFLFFYLWRQYERIRATARGAAQPNLNLAMVKALKVPNITLDEQDCWVSHFERIKSTMDEIGMRVDAVFKQKQSLLDLVFS